MKKFFVAIIAVLYFGVSSGMAVTIHYCMGKVSSVSFSSKEKACKCSKLAKKKMPCCKTESQLVKLNTDQQSNSITSFTPPVLHELILPYTIEIVSQPVAATVATNFSNGPPLTERSPLYLQYGVFRI